jgi:pescadillo protein
MLEKQYHEELKMEIEGTTFSNISNKKADIPDVPDDAEGDESEEAKEDDPIKQAADDAEEISKSLMSNRKRGLLKAMEVHVLY